jgi:hypothetical protein
VDKFVISATLRIHDSEIKDIVSCGDDRRRDRRPAHIRRTSVDGGRLRHNQPGLYQIQAAINAVHNDAKTAADTDWQQILFLYDQLLAFIDSPIVSLNRAVAVAEVDGPDAALAVTDGLRLDGYTSFTLSERIYSGASTAKPRLLPPTIRRSPLPATRPSEPF